MKKLLCGLMCSALVLSPVAALASEAHLANPVGKVMADRGNGYEAVVGGLELKAGDQVFVGAESSTSLVYANGCTVSVAEGSVVTVADKAPCEKNAAVVADTVIVPTADMDSADTDYSAAALPLPLILLLIGGGAAVVTTIVLVSDDSNSPATP